jgi:hypothetical protein
VRCGGRGRSNQPRLGTELPVVADQFSARRSWPVGYSRRPRRGHRRAVGPGSRDGERVRARPPPCPGPVHGDDLQEARNLDRADRDCLVGFRRISPRRDGSRISRVARGSEDRRLAFPDDRLQCHLRTLARNLFTALGSIRMAFSTRKWGNFLCSQSA